MKKASGILWGTVLIAAGVLLALNTFELISINIFFDGWWTLFMIVPCAIGLVCERKKTGNIIGLIIGVLLLLCCQDIMSFDMLRKLIIPAVIIIIGLKLILGNTVDAKNTEKIKQLKGKALSMQKASAVFSEQNLKFDGEVFDGAELEAVFGGIKCDITNAVMTEDCVISTSAIFGGIYVLVPPNVNVRVRSSSLFGGVSDKTQRSNDPERVTVYIEATCMFGGVDIK